jgi:hypothetical protein
MINFNFNLSNPWSKRWENVWSHTYDTPFKNKYLELEVIKDTSIVSFMFRLHTRTDHGGLYVSVGLLGYDFSVNFYDSRHWSYDLGRYFIYDEKGNES